MKNKPKLTINIDCIKFELKVDTPPVIYRKSKNNSKHMFSPETIRHRVSSHDANDSICIANNNNTEEVLT